MFYYQILMSTIRFTVWQIWKKTCAGDSKPLENFSKFKVAPNPVVGGAVASWLVRSSPDRAVWVRALAGDIVLCSWARHFTFTVPLSTQEYKWVPANCWGNLTNCWGVTCDGLASRPGGVEILLAASCYRNRDKLRQL